MPLSQLLWEGFPNPDVVRGRDASLTVIVRGISQSRYGVEAGMSLSQLLWEGFPNPNVVRGKDASLTVIVGGISQSRCGLVRGRDASPTQF